MSRNAQPGEARSVGLIAATTATLVAVAALAIVAAATVKMPQPDMHEVGDYSSLAVGEVRRIAEQRDWVLHEQPANGAGQLAGTVVGQHPAPQTRLAKGATLRVEVVDGAPPRAVPDLTGLTLAEAQHALALSGLRATVTNPQAEELVVSQCPGAGTLLNRHSSVEVVVTDRDGASAETACGSSQSPQRSTAR